MIDLVQLSKLAEQAAPQSEVFFRKNKKRLESMDDVVHELHHRFTAQTDCLACANCCRTLGPRITDKDVERIAKVLRMKPSVFYNTYLRTDEDGDMVFSSMPCSFLMTDNHCMIYENRPKACREYPHTDRKKFYQIANLSVQNTSICPIVYQVIEALKTELK